MWTDNYTQRQELANDDTYPVAPGWQMSENSGSVGSLRGHLFLPSGPGVVLGQSGGPSSVGERSTMCAPTSTHATQSRSAPVAAARSDGMVQCVCV
jgi:hypothetical protein